MTVRALTLQDVIDYHVAEVEAYMARSSGWAQSAEDLKALGGQANAVRIDKFDACAQLAADIAVRHAEMADLLEALEPKS
jgi:hypothetical protein